MSDERFMLEAIRLAKRGQGRVEPNPMVGAVVVRDGTIIARGWHRKFGGPHAEVDAMRSVDIAGCDIYVTLEPCSHHGKTPPCAEALIRAKPKRVFAAMVDPYNQVAGRGIAMLRDAGIDVHVGLCEPQARQLNAPYLKRIATGLPWVIAKWAQTIDGRIATAAADSKWISNDHSRHFVHQLRARVDAVIVGVNTVIADDPQLTARDVKILRQARRVVIDPTLRLPRTAKLLQPGPPLTVAIDSATTQRLPGPGVEHIHLPIRNVLEHLAREHHATNVLVEGGATLLGSLFAENLIDQTLVFIAPRILGDEAAIPAVRGLKCDRIDLAHRFTLHQSHRFGDDMLLDYRPVR